MLASTECYNNMLVRSRRARRVSTASATPSSDTVAEAYTLPEVFRGLRQDNGTTYSIQSIMYECVCPETICRLIQGCFSLLCHHKSDQLTEDE